MLPVTSEDIVKEMLEFHWMQKARNAKLENDHDNDDDEVTLTRVDKNFKGTCYACRKKGFKKKDCLTNHEDPRKQDYIKG